MKRAVIFGVSGQDGAFLAQLLLEKGYQVMGVSRNMKNASFQNLETLGIKDKIQLISLPLEDYPHVAAVIGEYAPHEIYNLSGQSSVARSFEKPFETFESISTATQNLLEAVRLMPVPVKLYNACSGDCFGNMDGRPVTEESPFRPRSPYAVAKMSAFWQVAGYREAYDLFACSGILFNHESCFRPAHFVTRKIVRTACCIARGECDELRLGDISIERDWGWAPEYVTAMWLMLQQREPEDFIIATGTTMRLQDFIDEVFQRLGLDWKKYVKTDSRFLRPADIQTIRTDPRKAAEKLNWKARYNGRDVAAMMVDAEQARR